MARHKDSNWNLPDGERQPSGSSTHSWQSIQSALLMDLRDELKELNRTLACYRVREAMDAIRRIDRRLARTHPLRRAKR